MKLTLITPPESAPVSVSMAKAHSRVLGDQEDNLVELYLRAATAELDGPTGVIGRCFMLQKWRLDMADWMGPVALRVEPVNAIEVRYIDAAGDEQVLDPSSWVLDDDVSRSPRLYWRGVMPALGDDPWPVRIEIEGGRAQPEPDAQVAILLRAAALFEHREAMVTGTAVAANPAYDALVAKLRRNL